MSVTGEHPRPHPTSPPAWPGSLRLPQRRRAGWRQRIRWALLARWHAETLDRELAAGGGSRAGGLIEMRAQQLTTHRSRHRLAGGLDRVQRHAASEVSGLTAVVAPDRHEVTAAAREIATLECRLRDGERIDAAGAAMVRLLLTDGTSSLYDPVGPGSLARHLRVAAAALESHDR
jgi:hypothetical protein